MFKLRKQKGASTIEFALGFIFFWYMCAAWVEMSLMSYISSIGDLAISKAAQVAKKNEGDVSDFITLFRDTLEEDGSIWSYAVSSENFEMSISYLESFDDLADFEACDVAEDSDFSECGDATDAAIAVYRFDYSYSPIFSIFLSDESLFSREMIVIQEYQRSEFEVY
jgi:tight adherence protein E